MLRDGYWTSRKGCSPVRRGNAFCPTGLQSPTHSHDSLTANQPHLSANTRRRASGLPGARAARTELLAPVIACDVRLGPLDRMLTSGIDGFADRLVAAIPTLHEHPCSRGGPGGFVERLREGTRIPHVLEHVALELQTLAGCDVSFGRVVPSGDEDVWWVIVEYEEEDVGIESMRDAA